MLLAEPQPTPADWQFTIAGIPVRVSAWFWLGAALLGWGICQSFAQGDQRALIGYLILWAVAVLVSILIHELGHALAYRYFGQGSQIVIYHLGGLAIPDAWGRRAHLRPIQRLVVSAAGPLAQLALAAVIVAGLRAAGYSVPFPIAALGEPLGLYEGRRIESLQAFAFTMFMLSVNIYWPLLNLLPVPPLDGGQIVREGMLAMGVADAHKIAALLGVAVGALVAYWGYTRGQPFLGIMFAMLAVSCWQSLSAGGSRWR
jgi:stage IV sporulation protein FB